MRRLDLYIDGHRADISESSLFLMTWTRDEASNPTTIINSSSQSVTLPATPANDRIFGHFSRPDRVTPPSGFDPLVRTPYEVRVAGSSEIICSGYLKLDTIQRAGRGVASYTVTLYGGLGGFFYGLAYNADGSRRTLGDLRYLVNPSLDPKNVSMPLTAATVKAAWATLEPDAPLDKGWWDIVNFAPALNGIPTDNFDAQSAVYEQPDSTATDQYNNIPMVVIDGGVRYAAINNTVLLNFENSHTEWEVQDLRAYLQRPVVRIWAILEALRLPGNVGGYDFSFELYDHERNDFPWIGQTWMTLPMFDRTSKSATACTLYDLLAASPSVSNILIGIAKALGLVFLVDEAQRKVRMISRDTYYAEMQDDAIDLSGRVCSEVTMSPNIMDKHFYVWQPSAVPGAFAKTYEEMRGARYGSQRVDTGYGFNSERADVLENDIFRGAADVRDARREYRYGEDVVVSVAVPAYKMAATETVTYDLYSDAGNPITWTMRRPRRLTYYVQTPMQRRGGMFMDLAQFCDADRKAEDGSQVLLFFDSMQSIPDSGMSYPMFHLSDDTEEMLNRNSMKPCWDITRATSSHIINITRLPSFRRWKINNTNVQGFTPVWDFGIPAVVGFNDPPVDARGVYDLFWSRYIADRFDRDTKVVRMKVNLLGLQVDAGLLRRFFRWEGCLWTLNKINNYSLTTFDPCECEFVQVKDLEAYTNGQF